MTSRHFLKAASLAFSGLALFSGVDTFAKGNPMHPCYLTNSSGKQETLSLISNESWAKEVFEKLKQRTDVYADKGPEWLTSRLMMYWNSHSTDVFIKGEFYESAGGNKAPVPTVMYTGARSHATNYLRPKIEELEPYAEDPRGLYLANRTAEGNPKEWVPIGKTGNIIQSINVEILGIARDAAFLWWLTGEEKYALPAESVFDTYMKGIYHRNVPVDLNHGHQQTLVGMSSFEVIHEDAINALVPLYDFLYDRLQTTHKDDIPTYEAAFKKWADNIIDNGVPHNNWNLIQARFIMDIGLILNDDAAYEDGKGKQYYIDRVTDTSSIRQWSLKDLAAYGFDPKTGIWAECPGYSQGVVNDYASFVQLFDRNLGRDLTTEIPVIMEAVMTQPQYLFPNRTGVGFGDTHPGYLRTDGIEKMIANARQHGKHDDEVRLTKLLRLFRPDIGKGSSEKPQNVRVAVNSLFANQPIVIDTDIEGGNIDDYVSPLFYAPNVSWVVQRSGMDPQSSLMASINGSEGNHMHANGINLELYGKGFTLAPDAGIGKSLYSGLDYLEYYSQFPSHNTVCVDGVSSYPVMKSNHPFKLTASFPESGIKGYVPLSYTSVDFTEPETMADQNRLTAIVEVDSTAGYYVDIFRSHRKDGKDKTHDYFYHNLGQSMRLNDASGNDLGLIPTEELAFAGANLYAYSYLYDKKSTNTDKDLKTVFTVDMPNGDMVEMNMWMKGEKDRDIFTALSPMTEGLTRTPGMPYDIAGQPTLTFVARQHGEAWDRPFTAIYEPASTAQPGTISEVSYPAVNAGSSSDVAIEVSHRNGYTDMILSSSDNTTTMKTDGMEATATYALARTDANGPTMMILGNGTILSTGTITITAQKPENILLRKSGKTWEYRSSGPATLTIGEKTHKLTPTTKFKSL